MSPIRWAQRDLNPQPSGLESDALTIAPWALVRIWRLNRLARYLLARFYEKSWDPGVEPFWCWSMKSGSWTSKVCWQSCAIILIEGYCIPVSRYSSVGRASDWRSEGPRFDPRWRHLFIFLLRNTILGTENQDLLKLIFKKLFLSISCCLGSFEI